MKKNMGTVDRTIRIILTIIFVILTATGVVKGVAAVVLCIISFFFLLTGIFGFCPTYTLFGIHTLRTKSGPDD